MKLFLESACAPIVILCGGCTAITFTFTVCLCIKLAHWMLP